LVAVTAYRPENFSSLSQDTTKGISAEKYQACIDKNKKLPHNFYSATFLSDGFRVKGIIAIPKDESQKLTPLVVAIRGGNREFSRWYACNLDLISDLYGGKGKRAVFAVQLRQAAGSEGKDEFGGGEVTDVTEAISISKSLPNVDSKNIFLAGWSRGGFEVYNTLRKSPSVNAAISIAGMSDLQRWLLSRADMQQDFEEMIPNYKLNPQGELLMRSAVQ
jgi:dipeptidyl aminopeptidase/acylaminoacyl peptidase